nr:hypothetical protein Itr_chr07CG12910 [Ipomoea trifida]
MPPSQLLEPPQHPPSTCTCFRYIGCPARADSGLPQSPTPSSAACHARNSLLGFTTTEFGVCKQRSNVALFLTIQIPRKAATDPQTQSPYLHFCHAKEHPAKQSYKPVVKVPANPQLPKLGQQTHMSQKGD